VLNVASALKILLSGSWTASVSPKYCIQNYGLDVKNLVSMFNPTLGCPQISINDEVSLEQKPIIRNIYRTKHKVLVGVFTRPVTYVNSVVSGSQASFRTVVTEVDRILRAKRYTGSVFNEIVCEGWKYETNKDEEPVYLVAVQTVVCTYVEGDNE